jgi:hypothetical protein
VETRPSPCGVDDPAAVAAVSPITHLVMIRGMPARLFNTGYIDDFEDPALDPALAFLLYHNESEVPQGTGVQFAVPLLQEVQTTDRDFTPYVAARRSMRYLRALSASRDRFASYGRVEAMTEERTIDLIDRTLAAEASGFQGNVVAEMPREFDALRERTASLGDACLDYIDDGTTWPHATCRAGTTFSRSASNKGAVPGEGNSEIPQAVNVGMMIGKNFINNGQAGFDGFGTLTNWRKSGTSCTPLCADTGDPGACAAASTDFFQELNTSCVGVAPGAIGYQHRSYPVSYYGFYPPGWSPGGNGASERTPPEVRSGGAADGSQYLHLGQHAVGAADTSQCVRANGATVSCLEHIVTDLEGGPPAWGTAIPLTRDFDVSFSYRSQTAGTLTVHLVFGDSDGTVYVDTEQVALAAASSWQPAGPINFSAAGSGLDDIKSIYLILGAPFSGNFKGFLDLDDVQIEDVDEEEELLSASMGSFEATAQNQTHLGDYASNAIDRLGAVGWWGSSSHFMTSGHAFKDPAYAIRSFFSGRGLGESVILASGLSSGLIYGDPLYRPSAAALYFGTDSQDKRYTVGRNINSAQAPSPVGPIGEGGDTTWMTHETTVAGQLITEANKEAYRDLFVNVLHGTDHLEDVNWQLSTCTGTAGVPKAADDCTSWTNESAQTGAVKEHRIDWMEELIDDEVDQFVVIRLKVWNDGEESQALYDYSYVDYRANSM